MDASLQLALGKRVLDLMGLELDESALMEIGLLMNSVPAGQDPASTLADPGTQRVLARVVQPKEIDPSTVKTATRCPFCNRSFVLDRDPE